MTDNKLFNLFESLNSAEKRSCSKLINSPFFNQKEDITQLWNWLMKRKQQKKRDIPTAQEAFKLIYPKSVYKDAKWRHLQSQLIALIEKSLVQKQLQDNPIQADLQLASIYGQKNLPLHLAHVFRRTAERIAQLPKDRNYYYYHYQLEWEKYAAIESTERGGKKNLENIETSMDVYLISSKLRLACVMEAHKTVSNIEYDTTFLTLILAYLEGHSMLKIPAIGLYYYCYKSLSSGTESDFRAFRKTLEQQEEDIPNEERMVFLLLAINYCIKQLNSGNQRYILEALELYQIGLQTKILFSEGYLSRFAYKNITALALKLKRFDWVEIFIDQYATRLKTEYREANRNYNLARLYFTQKEFKKAMPLLAQVDDSDLLLKLDSKVMLLKMYFEMEEYNALDNLMTSFRILLLRKKKIIGYHQQHYLNMLRFFRKMIRLNPYDKEAVERFKMEVTNHSSVIEREWILDFVSRWKR